MLSGSHGFKQSMFALSPRGWVSNQNPWKVCVCPPCLPPPMLLTLLVRWPKTMWTNTSNSTREKLTVPTWMDVLKYGKECTLFDIVAFSHDQIGPSSTKFYRAFSRAFSGSPNGYGNPVCFNSACPIRQGHLPKLNYISNDKRYVTLVRWFSHHFLKQ